MANDVLKIEILDDGTIKVTTDEISAANHASADKFVTFLARLAGGATTVTKRTKHAHTHAHEHAETKG